MSIAKYTGKKPLIKKCGKCEHDVKLVYGSIWNKKKNSYKSCYFYERCSECNSRSVKQKIEEINNTYKQWLGQGFVQKPKESDRENE